MRANQTSQLYHAARRCLPSWRADEDGASTVVGGILLAGLLFTLLATIQLNFAPVWTKDAEADHAATVLRDLASMKSEIDRQVANVSAIPVTHAIDLHRDSVGVFDTGRIPTRLAFESEDTTVSRLSALGLTVSSTDITVSTNRLLITSLNGESAGALDENSWAEIPATTSVTNVSKVLELRLRIDEVDTSHGGDDIQIDVTDANSVHAGTLRVYVETHPSGYDVNVNVTDAAGDVLYDQGEAYFLQDPRSPFWLDLLSSEYRFKSVLGAAAKPMTLELTENGLTGDFLISYEEAVEGSEETILTTQSGDLREPFTQTYDGGGRMFAETNNKHFPDQDFLYENGAVILQQDGSAAMKLQPHMKAKLLGNVTKLEFVQPALKGSDTTVQGSSVATIQTSTDSSNQFIALAPKFQMNLTTNHPTIWSDFWDARFSDAGIPSSYYTISTGVNYANLTVLGDNTDPNSIHYDLVVTFSHGVIATEIVL